MKNLLFAVLTIMAATSVVAAQQNPVQTLAEVQTLFVAGEKVRITDSAGKITQGELISLTPGSLRVKAGRSIRDWREADILELQKRRPDPAWNGTLYGAAIGGATGMVIASALCPNDPECRAITTIVFLPAGLGVGAATGALIDFSIRKFDTIFKAPGGSLGRSIHLSPVLSKGRKGAALSFTF